jgi:transposase
MQQQLTELSENPKATRLDLMSREELIQRIAVMEFELQEVIRENYKFRNLQISESQLQLLMQEQIDELRAKMYGPSSERQKNPDEESSKGLADATGIETTAEAESATKPRVRLPSERYPNLPVRDELITQNPAPSCIVCGKEMEDSGMFEQSEQLTVIPKKYEIIRQQRVKFRCSCQGCLVTTPLPERIIPGSSYSDEMIVDVALSKYCDLLPIDRYSAMAARGGVSDLPPQSLIELTHGFADFVSPVYKQIKNEIQEARVLQADETPHRMLEGSEKSQWYLWGFSTSKSCLFECRNTRSGDVASDFLLSSKCEVLLTDVYTGYGKAVRETNEKRLAAGKTGIVSSAYCNAHARRYFFKASPGYKEAQGYLDDYQEIYRLESQAKSQGPPGILEIRSQMRPLFEAMKKRAEQELPSYSEKSKYSKALRYFLENYPGLTLFLEDAEIPVDNNSQERLLRNHVVGRKTWYGTHSPRGAITAAILFTVVESCKLNKVNPREYFKILVEDLLTGRPTRTPAQFYSANNQ